MEKLLVDLTLSSLQTFMAKTDKTLFSAIDARLNRILYAINRSVITRLTSRSLSGQSLHIQVHHHFGFRLHLIWQCGREWNKKQKILIMQEILNG